MAVRVDGLMACRIMLSGIRAVCELASAVHAANRRSAQEGTEHIKTEIEKHIELETASGETCTVTILTSWERNRNRVSFSTLVRPGTLEELTEGRAHTPRMP